MSFNVVQSLLHLLHLGGFVAQPQRLAVPSQFASLPVELAQLIVFWLLPSSVVSFSLCNQKLYFMLSHRTLPL